MSGGRGWVCGIGFLATCGYCAGSTCSEPEASQDQPSEGLFTEGCFALVEGDYTEEANLVVIAIGHPPCENREAARSIYGHIDFLGKGATTLAEDVSLPSGGVRTAFLPSSYT